MTDSEYRKQFEKAEKKSRDGTEKVAQIYIDEGYDVVYYTNSVCDISATKNGGNPTMIEVKEQFAIRYNGGFAFVECESFGRPSGIETTLSHEWYELAHYDKDKIVMYKIKTNDLRKLIDQLKEEGKATWYEIKDKKSKNKGWRIHSSDYYKHFTKVCDVKY